MTRQELENKTVKELCEMCKERNLTYYTHKKKLTKPEIIEKILINQDDIEDINKMINESVETEQKKLFVVDNSNGKLSYIETIQIGTLVAFREPETNKLNTAKVTNKSVKNKKLKVETQYGAEFVISYDSVVWVKTGTRWPKGIYNELKGIKNE